MSQTVFRQPRRVFYGEGDFDVGLFQCCDDMSTCALSFCCLPCFKCFLARKLGESCCLPFCYCHPFDLSVLRVKLRTNKQIEGDALSDCCLSCWCSCCVAAQLSREVDD
ncbi:cornifelin-like [Ptychodera flava]|uniref:cornifelin-like n=1 Tax=Ptychodera flava TaxID=63121 RepID=UPI00396A68E0